MGKKRAAWLVFVSGLLLAAAILLIDVARGRQFELGTIQLALAAAGLLASLVAAWFLAPTGFRQGLRVFLYVSLLPAALGLLLLAVNVLGLGLSMRDPQADQGFTYGGKFRIAEGSEGEVLIEIRRQAGESNRDYARRLTSVVYDSVIHYWEGDGNKDLRVPIWENWLLWLNGTDPYEFCAPEKAIERRVGVCSQVSKILVSTLQVDGGFDAAYSYALDGHVVAQVLVEDDGAGNETWWVLDSDFGVVLEHSVAYLEQHPDEVASAYSAAGYDADISQRVAGYFGPEGNYEEGNAGLCREEAQAYADKWTIPLWMIAPALVLFAGDKLLTTLSKPNGKRR